MASEQSPLRPEAIHADLPYWLGRSFENGVTPEGWLRMEADRADSCLEFQGRIAERLRLTRERLGATLQEGEQRRLEALTRFLESRRTDIRGRVEAMGLHVECVTHHAMKWACALQTGRPREEISGEDLQPFLQELYDEAGTAAGAFARVIRILEEAGEGCSLRDHFIKKLKNLGGGSSAKRLQRYGVALRPAQEVQRARVQEGASHAARKKGIEALAAMNADELERHRIHWAEERKKSGAGLQYAGRRKDIVDANGHHPYFTSIHHANFARDLTDRGIGWVYKPRVFQVSVPDTEESIPQRTIAFEPTFYLVKEDRYIDIVTDRRFGNKPGSTEERLRRAEVIDRLTHLKIRRISEREVSRLMLQNHGEGDMETLPKRKKNGEMGSGSNIHEEFDRYGMEINACPCATCQKTNVSYGS